MVLPLLGRKWPFFSVKYKSNDQTRHSVLFSRHQGGLRHTIILGGHKRQDGLCKQASTLQSW